MDTPKPRPPLLRRRLVRVVAVAAAVLFVVAALVFEPWNLVIDKRVDEVVPVVAAAAPVAPAVVAEPTVLARGTLISHEHESSGSVALLRLADGSRVLRLENLQTSNGPALRVWMTDAPVIEGTAGWTVFDDGRYLDLGDLKGNIGSSNYPIPADADLTGLSSVSVWCERFHVSFAAAQLDPTA
jgi:Electron transfer DM13